MRKRVKITESQIKRIIAESTRKVLNEEMLDHSFLDRIAETIGSSYKNPKLAAELAFEWAIEGVTRCGISASKFVQALKDMVDEDIINKGN